MIARRLVAGVAGVVLHIAVIAVLMAALNSHVATRPIVREVSLLLLKPPPPPKSPVLPLPPMLAPLLEAPEAIIPQSSAPPSVSAVPMPPGMAGVGRALFGCNALESDKMGEEERSQCLGSTFGKPREQSVGLGPPPDPDSPWARAVAERNAPVNPINTPCPPGSYQDTHGLPCFRWDQQAPALPALH